MGGIQNSTLAVNPHNTALSTYTENFMALGPNLWEKYWVKDQKVSMKYTYVVYAFLSKKFSHC